MIYIGDHEIALMMNLGKVYSENLNILLSLNYSSINQEKSFMDIQNDKIELSLLHRSDENCVVTLIMYQSFFKIQVSMFQYACLEDFEITLDKVLKYSLNGFYKITDSYINGEIIASEIIWDNNFLKMSKISLGYSKKKATEILLNPECEQVVSVGQNFID